MAASRYSSVAILFHWIIAALILTNIYLGIRMEYVQGLAKFSIFQLHKSIGLTVLVLSVLRLAWRLIHRPPPGAPGLKPWEHAASLIVHWGFYIIMIGMPLTGWIVVSTSPLNIPTLLYHTIPWPHFPVVHDLAAGPKSTVNHVSATSHVILAWGAIVLLVLHIGAVIKHQFLDRHPVLWRMAPLGRPTSTPTEP